MSCFVLHEFPKLIHNMAKIMFGYKSLVKCHKINDVTAVYLIFNSLRRKEFISFLTAPSRNKE